jgi:nucleoside-triphosphate--adenylate kinase|eukprot:COSAG02_NODE_733_length_17960_cov_122.222440_2_plen_250_part_00
MRSLLQRRPAAAAAHRMRFAAQPRMLASAAAAAAAERKFALIMGPPGGGKGTISKKILKEFPFHHLSTGDELRAHVQNSTAVGLEAKEYMDSGALVPDELIIRLVLEEVEKLPTTTNVLLDGFPRTQAQAEALSKEIKVDMVINLDIPQATIVERMSGRWIHMASGRVYAYDYNPPKEEGKDDVTGEALEQREDDKPETVMARLDKYAEMTVPLIEYYDQDSGVLGNFAGTESDVIYPEVRKFLSAQGL